ncbi:11153_t:CDS:2, partial [Entrophospora sp. SA101]
MENTLELDKEITKLKNKLARLEKREAKIITEIELFYLFPNQRRWRNWFPDTLYYDAPIGDICKKIKEIDDSNENEEDLPYISDRLRELAEVTKKTENNFDSKFQQIEDKFVEVTKKTENDFDSRFQQIENKFVEVSEKTENNFDSRFQQIEDKLVEVSKKTENDIDSRFQQIENILENNMKEMEKNLKDGLKEMENKFNNNNDQ